MSHFTVLVIGENPEEQLAPFQENNMEDCPKEFLVFNDEEAEYLKQYETDGTERIFMPDGRILLPWNETFRKSGSIGTGSNTHEVPTHLEKREVPFKETYPTFEAFMSDWCGKDNRDETTGKYGYWENPNAKWDWYSLGGRWTGFFKLKIGVEALTGKPGLMTPEADDGYGDAAKKSEIDFEYMKTEAANKARQEYHFAVSVFKNIPESESWESIRERIKDRDEARTFYWSQPRQIAWKEKEKELGKGWPFGFSVSPEDFQMSEQDYIQKAISQAYTPFAILHNGKWYEKGKMGWWATVHNEDSDWNKKALELIDSLPEDTMLSIYDCHI